MYYAKINEEKVPVGQRLKWVKQQTNGKIVLCEESEGQGIVVDGDTYHVFGRGKIDKPTVHLVWEDPMLGLIEMADAMAEYIVEQEYKNIMGELGVMV